MVLLLVATGCVDAGSGAPVTLEAEQDDGVRGPVALGRVAYVRDPFRVTITVPTCGGEPVLTRFDEGPDVIELEVVSTSRDPSDGCQDALDVVLEARLGGREVLDVTSGDVLELQEEGDGS